MGLIDEISTNRKHIGEKIRGIFLPICLRGQGFITPCCFDHIRNRLQSLFFFRFSEGSARARERRAAKPRETRNVTRAAASLAFGHAHSIFQGVVITPIVPLIINNSLQWSYFCGELF